MIHDIALLLNIFLLESLLSIDNAAVLALMVKDLPKKQRPKALKYGIFGAFAFRGLSLFIASWLVQILWLKIIGGAYLLYLTYGHFTSAKDTIEEGVDKEKSKIYLAGKNRLGQFWTTVILVEVMDIAFSIDNIFAAVAITENITLILAGVFIGIIAMRFIAQWFTKLIVKFPTLEKSAFIVIGILGIKLITAGVCAYYPGYIDGILKNHFFDFFFSAGLMTIFFFPIIFKKHQILN